MADKRKDAPGSPDGMHKKVKGQENGHATPLDVQCINTIRCLGADMPFKAKSGHPGAPMGCAPMAHALWGYAMNYSPAHPEWIARDRFVLSNGHGCALQYGMLHLAGYDVSKEQLTKFRQLGSITPGHPECFVTPGIEVCTGPLGQGISNAVGMAMASHQMAETYNKDGLKIFDNYVYAICGDGCLQEGVSAESASLAGHLGLGRLIVLYDSNKISIDGNTDMSFTEDVLARYQAYGWHTQEVTDGDSSHEHILAAVHAAKAVTDKPSIIKIKTTIGFGSKLQGTEKVHGAPLAEADLQAVKTQFGLNPTELFQVPAEVAQWYKEKAAASNDKYAQWCVAFEAYRKQFPKEAAEIERRFALKPIENFRELLPKLSPSDKADGTRSYSGKVLNAIFHHMPELVGGSADLAESNKTDIHGAKEFQKNNFAGRYVRFGVREHGMAAVCNGLFAYGGMRPFAATFFNFITYAWGAVRLSALSRFGILYIATHDSIELGEDGPTHQPVETLALMRATPNFLTYRPGDGVETNGAYVGWVEHPSRPTLIALSRAAVPPVLEGTSIDGCSKGGYVTVDFANTPGAKKVILAGSGSDLQFCYEARQLILSEASLQGKVDVRIVSMPCWDLFAEQSEEYRRSVLPHDATRLYVEAGSTYGWDRYFNVHVGMTTFGASAPKAAVQKLFGFNKHNVANSALEHAGLPAIAVPDAEKAGHAHHHFTGHPLVENVCKH